MQLDIEIRPCSRMCASTERPLQPGEAYFSILLMDGNEMIRRDYSTEAWRGPPDDCIGWWRSRIPPKEDSHPKLAPVDVLLNLFEALEDHPTEREFRYLLGLLLLRRKSLRREDTTRDDQSREVLVLHCPWRDKEFELLVAEPSAEQIVKLQQQMYDLLYASSDGARR